MHVRRGEAEGLGHAVLKARPIIGNEPFVVVLPDVILDETSANLKTENLAAMLNRYYEVACSQIMVELVSNYGVADCAGHDLQACESKAMTVVGRYVLSAQYS